MCDQCERFVLKRCCGNTDNSMHIAVHPDNNKGDGDEDYGDDDDKQNTSTDFTAILALPKAKAKTCLSEGNIREHDLVCVFYVAGRRLDESFMPKKETLK